MHLLRISVIRMKPFTSTSMKCQCRTLERLKKGLFHFNAKEVIQKEILKQLT